MKRILYLISALALFVACDENTVDSMQTSSDEKDEPKTLYDYMNRSRSNVSSALTDSLKILSIAQSDVNTMMMNQVCQKDGIFILAISRTDALSLGVSDELYDYYVDYVARLNEQLAEIQ